MKTQNSELFDLKRKPRNYMLERGVGEVYGWTEGDSTYRSSNLQSPHSLSNPPAMNHSSSQLSSAQTTPSSAQSLTSGRPFVVLMDVHGTTIKTYYNAMRSSHYHARHDSLRRTDGFVGVGTRIVRRKDTWWVEQRIHTGMCFFDVLLKYIETC